jgi:hypothetical protein
LDLTAKLAWISDEQIAAFAQFNQETRLHRREAQEEDPLFCEIMFDKEVGE